MSAPAIVWADEPTGALDSESAADIMDLLGAVNAAGQTVVMVTHAPEVGERAHRIVRMRDGRIETDLATARHPSSDGTLVPVPGVLAPSLPSLLPAVNGQGRS